MISFYALETSVMDPEPDQYPYFKPTSSLNIQFQDLSNMLFTLQYLLAKIIKKK